MVVLRNQAQTVVRPALDRRGTEVPVTDGGRQRFVPSLTFFSRPAVSKVLAIVKPGGDSVRRSPQSVGMSRFAVEAHRHCNYGMQEYMVDPNFPKYPCRSSSSRKIIRRSLPRATT
jgi:hypothetical protein